MEKLTEKPIEQTTMIPFPPFDYRVYVHFINNLKDSVEIVNKKEKFGMTKERINEVAYGGGFHLYSKSRPTSHVFLPVYADSNQIVHECYHVVSNMFRWIEAEHEEEVFAYHLGYLVQQVITDFKKMLEKRQKRLDKGDERVYTVPKIDLPGCN